MKKTKKVLGMLLAALMIASTAIGCSQGGDSGTDSQGASSDDKSGNFELSISHWMLSDANFSPGSERLKHSNLSTIPKKGRTKPSPLRAGEK